MSGVSARQSWRKFFLPGIRGWSSREDGLANLRKHLEEVGKLETEDQRYGWRDACFDFAMIRLHEEGGPSSCYSSEVPSIGKEEAENLLQRMNDFPETITGIDLLSYQQRLMLESLSRREP